MDITIKFIASKKRWRRRQPASRFSALNLGVVWLEAFSETRELVAVLEQSQNCHFYLRIRWCSACKFDCI
jgi:hypothetical protein